MKNLIISKKLTFFLFILTALVFTIPSCKEEKIACPLSQIQYNDNTYIQFQTNNDEQITQMTHRYKQNGSFTNDVYQFTYSNGNLTQCQITGNGISKLISFEYNGTSLNTMVVKNSGNVIIQSYNIYRNDQDKKISMKETVNGDSVIWNCNTEGNITQERIISTNGDYITRVFDYDDAKNPWLLFMDLPFDVISNRPISARNVTRVVETRQVNGQISTTSNKSTSYTYNEFRYPATSAISEQLPSSSTTTGNYSYLECVKD